MLRDDPDYVVRKLAIKNFDAREIVDGILAIDDERKALQTESDALLSEQKKQAAVIGSMMKEGRKAEAEEAKKTVADLKPVLRSFSPVVRPRRRNSKPSLYFFPIFPATSSFPAKEQKTIR